MGMGDFFCVLRELIIAIGGNWFFLLGINFCDFQEVKINIRISDNRRFDTSRIITKERVELSKVVFKAPSIRIRFRLKVVFSLLFKKTRVHTLRFRIVVTCPHENAKTIRKHQYR